jgi:uncharacterized repeat protein (TIGR01451 family)
MDTSTETCPVQFSAGLKVTKVCPSTPIQRGELLTYTGTVSNPGNITLVNVVVVDDQPQPNTPVIGPIALAPGQTVNFTAGYIVPADFCGTDTITASGTTFCGNTNVLATATAKCTIGSLPAISLTKACPPTPVPPGGLLVYTGTVTNSGNVTLVGITVVDNQPTNNTPVIGPITLAPGTGTNFSGSYIANSDCCAVIDTLTAVGRDICTSVAVTNTATAVCPLLTTPKLGIGLVCVGVPTAGSVFTYSGSVTNTGDVTLTQVMVVSDQPAANTTLLGPIELAPGEFETFSGSFTAASGASPTVTASGIDVWQQRQASARANCSGPLAGLDRPLISLVTIANDVVTISWTATPGVTYCLQSKASLADGTWTTIAGNITATDVVASKADPLGFDEQRVYRVMIVEE